MKKITTRKLTYGSLCIALALVLPFLTGQIPQIGSALSPMHIPAFLSGFICGWPYGLLVGFVSPLLRSAILGMPPFLASIAMSFELATYGFLAGFLYKFLPKKSYNVYLSLLAAMFGGRIVWGIVQYILAGLSGTGFPLSAFWAGAVANAVPGILLHIILIPVIVLALQKAKVIPIDLKA